ncbi:hypothetical protein O9X98_06125 [Agrobacterium salinitolerans]|nr:hypothetical protein [Agrobacterium salinitolerans]
MTDDRREEIRNAWSEAYFPRVPSGNLSADQIFQLEELGPRSVNSLASFSLNRIGSWLERPDGIKWAGDERISVSWDEDAKGTKTCVIVDRASEKSWTVAWYAERDEAIIEVSAVTAPGTATVLAKGEIDDGHRVERLAKRHFYTTPSGPGAVMGRFHNEAYEQLFELTSALAPSMPEDFRLHTHDTVTGEVVGYLDTQKKVLAFDGGLPGKLTAAYVRAVLDHVCAPAAVWTRDSAPQFMDAMTSAGAVWGSASLVYHDGDITTCAIPMPDGSPAFYHGNRAKWDGEIGYVAWFESHGRDDARLCVQMIMGDTAAEDVVKAMLAGNGDPVLVFDYKTQQTQPGRSSAIAKEFFFFDYACDLRRALGDGKLQTDCGLWSVERPAVGLPAHPKP